MNPDLNFLRAAFRAPRRRSERLLFSALLLSLALASGDTKASEAFAQEATDGTLHVMRPIVHVEQDDAELCLEFDHDLDGTDHGRTVSSVKLEASGKTVPLKPQNVNVESNLLCLPSLEHHKEYRVVVTGLKGLLGEKLASPYGLTFTVPDRQPSLSFTGNAADEGMTRWQDNDPVLRSINVSKVHLELYRITDPAMMASAWRDREQTTLAPSESATFGHDHGQLMWSADMALQQAPNKTLEQATPLHDAAINAPNGLYLIVARAPEIKEIETDTETGAGTEPKVGALAATAASWLLKSNLKLHAVRDVTGFYGLTEKADGSGALADVHILAETASGETLTEAHTDQSGVSYLPLSQDKVGGASALIGTTSAGDVDFVDLNADNIVHFSAAKSDATLLTDKSFYAPAATAEITLSARDGHPHEVGSVLVTQRADGSAYASVPVNFDPNGSARIAVPVPAVGGLWPLLWKAADGAKLGETDLRVTANPDAPRIEISADKAIVPLSGDLNLTLRSYDGIEKPAPFIAGKVFVAWQSPSNIFKEWKDYHFGNGDFPAGDPGALVSFVTDAKGVASFRVNLSPPDDHILLHSAVLSVRSDAAAGVTAPVPLTLPLKPRENVVGIKPLMANGRFPENGLAQFSVVAVDADGHRRAQDDLAYQIFEEGRSFDWYQAEGRWNYRPEKQRRRIGGGTLSLKDDSEATIEWPVAAGTYRLEITDANGSLRASTGFSASSGAADGNDVAAVLPLAVDPPKWHPGQDVAVHFTFAKPSMMTAFVGDDRIRTLVHKFEPKGDNLVSFSPDKNWNGQLAVTVEEDAFNLVGVAALGKATEQPDSAPLVKQATADLNGFDAALPDTLDVGDVVRLTLDLSNPSKTAETYHLAFVTSAEIKMNDPPPSSVTVPPLQTKKISVDLEAMHAGQASLRLDASGPPHLHGERSWNTLVLSRSVSFGAAVRQRIEPQQATSWPPAEAPTDRAAEKPPKTSAKKQDPSDDKTKGSDTSIILVSNSPIYNAPSQLSLCLNADPFTTREIAGVIETLRVWRPVITAAGLLSPSSVDIRLRGLVMRLMSRQKLDGSFSLLPGGASDFVSTSESLVALFDSKIPAAGPATEQAVSWMAQQLSNTWFDESQRSDRAAGFAALAEVGRLDNATLHYFSDTSAQKQIQPLAAAQLAYAFAQINDEPASSFWIEKSGMRGAPLAVRPEMLAVLALNRYFDAQNLLPSLEAFSNATPREEGEHPDRKHDLKATTDALRATWALQDRKGGWQVSINGDQRSLSDILVLTVPPKTTPPLIRNTGSAALSLYGAPRIDQAARTPAAVTRHIYDMSGNEMNAHKPLARFETYLVVLEGSWTQMAAFQPIVHDYISPALRVTGCLPAAPIQASDSLGWLKAQNFTAVASCETWSGATDLMLGPHDGNSATWRVGYLAKADWSGSFELPGASLTSEGSTLSDQRIVATKVDIR